MSSDRKGAFYGERQPTVNTGESPPSRRYRQRGHRQAIMIEKIDRSFWPAALRNIAGTGAGKAVQGRQGGRS
jgi:hypothetical protein